MVIQNFPEFGTLAEHVNCEGTPSKSRSGKLSPDNCLPKNSPQKTAPNKNNSECRFIVKPPHNLPPENYPHQIATWITPGLFKFYLSRTKSRKTSSAYGMLCKESKTTGDPRP